ncbi:response regulator [Pendulispora rubella]|uniref:histidine kinase n=1 Tax=Pendulispora rubella TaxID=2741070 RepID=A0ABZ2KRM9_9BACT
MKPAVISLRRTSPPGTTPRILLALSESETNLVLGELERAGFSAETTSVDSPARLEERISGSWDIILAGTEFFGQSREAIAGFLDKLREVGSTLGYDLPAVFVARQVDDALERSALARGAADVIETSRLGRLGAVLTREVERVRRQNVRASRAALMEAIIDALPFLVFVKEARELRQILANQTFADAFHTTKEWLTGKLDDEIFPPDQVEGFNAIDREVLRTQVMKVFEEVARTDGVNRTYLTRKLAIVDEEGNSAYLVGVTEDITERKRTEEALRRTRELSARTLAGYQRRVLQMEIIRQQNEDLERLSADLVKAKRIEEERAREIEAAARLKSEFLANFSHEIRTPLNGILGYCDLLMRGEGSRLTPHGRRDLNVIKTNAKTLLSLINDILDLSKIEAGRIEIVRERVDVTELIEDSAATIKELIRSKDVELVTHVADGAAQAFTDSLKLRQIVLNLLSNAAKFTDTGEIHVSASAAGDDLVVEVEDTGVGIPPEELRNIFEKFRQVDGSSTRRAGGTGLGLAIVRELARVLGGTASVTSAVGRGSKFTVILPGAIDAGRTPSLPENKLEPRSVPLDGCTVLVVDDDPLVQTLVRGELETAGFQAIIVGDGVQALHQARARRPNVILLDLHLPKLHGWDVLTELKSDPSLSSIPVVIVSVEEQRARGFSMGACEYLVKPVETDQLVETVRRVMAPGGGDVLIVDDDAATRELVTRVLQGHGFPTADARDGSEALVRMKVSPPSLLILDLVMPKVDGFEVLRRMRSEGTIVPVVVLTGKDLSKVEEQELSEAFARIVRKGGLAMADLVAEARRLVVEQRVQQKERLPRILYVEDSPQNRDIVRRYLEPEFNVFEAEDGEHGLERAQRDAPDLVLMDLSLPRIDGWEATRRIKSDPRLRHLPVIALTARAGTEDRERADSAGCVDYLTKPVEREALIAAIRKHLRGQAGNG